MGAAMVKKVEIARAMGVSASAVSKYVRRGMPTSSVTAAKAWCTANLDPVRQVAQRMGLNAERSGSGRVAVSHLVAHAIELGRLALADFKRYETQLRSALRQIPADHFRLVTIDVRLWCLLTTGELSPVMDYGQGEVALAEVRYPDGSTVHPDDISWLWQWAATGVEPQED